MRKNASIDICLIHDYFIKGGTWIIGLNHYTDLIETNSVITICIDGLKLINISKFLEKKESYARRMCVVGDKVGINRILYTI